MDLLLVWISHYGYAGLFALLLVGIVGLPIPDETLLLFSGYLISQGRLQAGWTFACSAAGAICGISLSYAIGRYVGHPVIFRYGRYLHITTADVDRVHRWYRRTGEWLLSLGYFIPGVRHFTALVAGMSELEYPVFAFFAYGGAVIWVTTFLAIGYYLGNKWQLAIQLIHRYTAPFLMIAAFVIAFAWWLRTKLQSSKPQ